MARPYPALTDTHTLAADPSDTTRCPSQLVVQTQMQSLKEGVLAPEDFPDRS